MLRRRVAEARRSHALTLVATRGGFFDAFTGSKKSGDAKDGNTASGSGAQEGGIPGMPPGVDMQRLRTMQELFNSQTPEKQKEILKQAEQMQKVMSKLPGFNKMAEKNMAMMQQVLKTQEMQKPPTQSGSSGPFSGSSASNTATNRREMYQTPRASSSSSPSNSGGGGGSSSGTAGKGGPTLDDLKKISLGPEIEALFDELRVIRSKKNEYRDKYETAARALEGLQNDNVRLTEIEVKLRSELRKAQQDVMLLTSENMELRDEAKKVKQLSQEKQGLSNDLRVLQEQAAAGTMESSPAYKALQHQLQAREDALRSLQRKLDRMRRRDPLLQFSVACSDVARLCDAAAAARGVAGAMSNGVGGSGGSNNSSSSAPSGAVGDAEAEREAVQRYKEVADEAFASLQTEYERLRTTAWETAAAEGGRAAKAFVAVASRYVASCVPHANYDAYVTVGGDVAAATKALKRAGFAVEAVSGSTEPNRLAVCSPGDCESLQGPGPYGYAFAMRMAFPPNSHMSGVAGEKQQASGGGLAAAFSIEAVSPQVSTQLLNNPHRSTVTYETARASGPGGQATNVTETQVYARLSIDGVAAYTAEAQDSRSALSNKSAALEKLHGARRSQYNDTLARQHRPRDVAMALSMVITEANSAGTKLDASMKQLVRSAAEQGHIGVADVALVECVEVLSDGTKVQ